MVGRNTKWPSTCTFIFLFIVDMYDIGELIGVIISPIIGGNLLYFADLQQRTTRMENQKLINQTFLYLSALFQKCVEPT